MSFAGAINDLRAALVSAGLVEAPTADLSLAQTGRHTINDRFALQTISSGLPIRQAWIDQRGKRALINVQVGVLVENHDRNAAFIAITENLEKILDTLIGFTSSNVLTVQRNGNPPIAPVQDDRIIGTFPIEIRYTK